MIYSWKSMCQHGNMCFIFNRFIIVDLQKSQVIAQNYSHTLYHIALQLEYTIYPMLLMQHGEKKKGTQWTQPVS